METAGTEGLREALARVILPRFDARTLRPRMTDVRVRVQAHWSSVDPKSPPSLELRDIHASVRSAWLHQHTFADIPARYRRWVPWVLFFPSADDREWLVKDRTFCRAYVAWLGEGRRPGPVAALVKVLLQTYPTGLPDFAGLLRATQRTLRDSDSVRLDQWRRRDADFHVLHENGPALFAALLARPSRDASSLVTEAGFTGDLATGRFLELALDAWIATTATALRRGALDVDGLKRLLGVVAVAQTSLRFPSHRTSLANALLSPFSERDPSEEVRGILQAFFLDHFGDPRIGAAPGWQGINDAPRQVMFRWLVGATLEDFFRLIDSTAYEHHWRYRKAFWRAYLKAGVIRDAWAVLGPAAQRLARGTLARQGGFGCLDGGDDSHSVLLLRIGTLVVAEWSHSGTCRIWQSPSPQAPEFYKRAYRRSALRQLASFEQRHHHSDSGSWQAKVVAFIRSQTRLTIGARDYMP